MKIKSNKKLFTSQSKLPWLMKLLKFKTIKKKVLNKNVKFKSQNMIALVDIKAKGINFS